jgi:hypothetical protein
MVTGSFPNARNRFRTCVWTIAAVAVAGSMAFGAGTFSAEVIRGVRAMASSEEAPRVAANTVNELGFDYDTLTCTSTAAETTWNSLDETRESIWIMFNLGSVQPLNAIWVYNCNRETPSYRGRRLLTADIWTAKGNITTFNPTDAAPGGWTKLVAGQKFTAASYSEAYNTPTRIPMNASARYVIINHAVYEGPQSADERVYGLSKVIFHRASPGKETR